MVTRAAVIALIGMFVGTARAEPASLIEARRAIQDVRYDDARRLLVDALATGTNGPAELVEIYRMSAATAIVLGETELAAKYYRRMLALDPATVLPADTSPKLREPFVAAQAYMAAQGLLEAHVAPTSTGFEVSLTDPLGMVVAVAAPHLAPRRYLGAPIEISTPVDRIVLLDEHGNRLYELAVDTNTTRVPIVRRWTTWAIPAAVFAGAGIGFFLEARHARDDLADDIANSTMHYLDDATTARTREQRDNVIAAVSLATAGACAITAVVMAASRPKARTTSLQPTLARERVGLAIIGAF